MEPMFYKGRRQEKKPRSRLEFFLLRSPLITPSTKLMTLFNWRRIGRGVRKNSSSPPWVSPG
jgi:hypothetical protein